MQITRRFEIDAGHRVLGHEGKCRHPHGHRYVIELTCRPKEGLDDLGRVLDFSVIKDLFGGWVDAVWDHAFLVNEKDESVLRWLMDNEFRCYVFPGNPTAENMAAHLMDLICPALFASTNVMVSGVKIWETPNCSAEVKR